MSKPELQIHSCRIADIDAAALDACIPLLDTTEQQRLTHFLGALPRREFILSRALLRTTLAARLRVAPAALQFERNADGKPQLAAPFAHWHFNLSHSRDWVVVALGNVGPVGVDIESHERKNDLAAVAGRFFSVAENAALQHAPDSSPHDPQWLQRFFAIWTLKEAHAKALGCGLSKILSCSSFVPPAEFPAKAGVARVELALSGMAAAAQPVATWLYRPDADTSLAISQVGTTQVEPALLRWWPGPDGTAESRYVELAPIAAGNWRPGTAPPTQNANPRA
jgi:4'-phosphopantetheinyl transferase